jgi:hypothetical protein
MRHPPIDIEIEVDGEEIERDEQPDSGALTLAEYAELEFQAALERELDHAEFDYQPNLPVPPAPVAKTEPTPAPEPAATPTASGTMDADEWFEKLMVKLGFPNPMRRELWKRRMAAKDQARRKAA